MVKNLTTVKKKNYAQRLNVKKRVRYLTASQNIFPGTAFSGAANYRRSNAITTIEIDFRHQVRQIAAAILNSKGTARRQVLSQMLLDQLNRGAELPECRVKISDTRQYHRRSRGRIVFRQYGYYQPRTRYVYLQNRTPGRGQTFAPQSFLTTLLHEWLHHYDTYRLGLHSIHTRGFYLRLKSLRQLIGVPTG